MNMPSDATPEVSDATKREKQPLRREERWSTEQKGMAVAALVAFLGIAYVGPVFGRLLRKPRIEDRIAVRLRDARRRAQHAGGKARKRIRRLGGGPIRR